MAKRFSIQAFMPGGLQPKATTAASTAELLSNVSGWEQRRSLWFTASDGAEEQVTGHTDFDDLPLQLVWRVAGGESTVLERLQRLELRLPVVLSDQEEDNVYGSMFLLVDDTQGRKTKVTRQAVAAAEARAHGKAVPVYVGSGFFFKQTDLAVTAYHQLTDEQLSNSAKVSVFLPFSDRRKQLEFIGGDKELDVAYLRCTDGDNDQCFLEPQEVNLHRAMAMPLVTFTTHITVSSQFDTEPSFGQRQASITGFFKGGKVFTYNASTYKGDCGCPVLVHNGKVVGMHVGMVNSYQKGSSRSASLDSSGPHDAEAVLACKFPPVPAL